MSERQLTNPERAEIQEQLDKAERAEIAKQEARAPLWREEFEKRKEKIAIGQLKIEKDLEKLSQLEAKFAKLQAECDKVGEEKERLEELISSKLPKKMKKKDRWDDSEIGCPVPMSLCEAIDSRKQAIHQAEMEKHPVGKVVLEIADDFNRRRRLLSTCVFRSEVDEKGVLNF